MTQTTSKIRALFLAGLMVLSAFAMTMAFSGAATAAEVTRGNQGTWYTNNGTGTVGDDADVFQGEDDVEFAAAGVELTDFERSSGSDEGLPLEDPIPADQVGGSYDDGSGNSLRVVPPRITDHEIQLDNGEDIAGGTVPSDASNLTIWAEYNFAQAEDLDLSIRDGDGLEVTGETLVGGANYDSAAGKSGTASPAGEVSWNITVDNLDDEEYIVELEGVDDLDFGDAVVSDTFTISSEDDVSLTLEQSEVVQGEDVTFDIDGATEGDHHVLHIAQSDARNDGDASRVFRNAGDTVRSGVNESYAWAVVEIDGGVGTGSLRTAALTDTDVDVEVTETVDSSYTNQTTPVDQLEEADTATLTVTEGAVSLENPSGFYVPRSEVTVNGTADEGIDEVSFWARDQGAYERVQIGGDDTIDVSGEEFEEEDVVLSDSAGASGNDMLSRPGTYRFAVVAGDPAAGTSNPDQMTTTQVARNISDTTSLRVSESDIRVNVSTINGQVARGDAITISGHAAGGEVVNATFIGPRGNVDQFAGMDVDPDGTFEAENVRVGGHLRERFRSSIADSLEQMPGVSPAAANQIARNNIGQDFSEISEGTVILSVGHKGRDGISGDGTSSYSTIMTIRTPTGSVDRQLQGTTAMAYDFNTGSYTQSQAGQLLSSETGGDTGADDQSQLFTFRLTDPRTTVDDVVGEDGVSGVAQIGNEITVSGTTNRQPEDNAITVEAIDGPSSAEFPVETTEDWGTDGQWTVTLNTTGLEPGNYTVEASDGDSADVRSFSLSEDAVSQDDEPTETETTDALTEQKETEEPAEMAAQQAATDTATEQTDGETGPGFGVAVALVGLIALALLAVCRND